ncbi:MAG: hypothetical protein ACU4EQ_13335 [Candidatus Nitrosoglobus sp.]
MKPERLSQQCVHVAAARYMGVAISEFGALRLRACLRVSPICIPPYTYFGIE